MFTQPEVFISYSRLDPGGRPEGTDSPDVQKWLARSTALDLIAALEEKLSDQYRFLRDDRILRVGDPVISGIDAALMSCAGAVVVLDPEAVERSPWVQSETSILMWRSRVTGGVRVVAVAIGVDPEKLKVNVFKATGIGDALAATTAATVDPASATYDADLESTVKAIAAALGELDRHPVGPLARWADAIAACLPKEADLWRPYVAPTLAPHEQRLKLAQNPRRLVATELLTAVRPRFKDILGAFDGFPFVDDNTLRRNLEPLWVEPTYAPAMEAVLVLPPGQRIIAIKALEAATGVDVIRRAFPGAYAAHRLEWTPGSAVDRAAAVQDAVEQIEEKWADGPGEEISPRYPSFVVMAAGGGQAADLVQIAGLVAEKYPELTYVLMVGDADVGELLQLDPQLEPSADDRKHRFDKQLQDLIPDSQSSQRSRAGVAVAR